MASKTKRDQIITLKTAGISNCDMTKQLNVCRETVFNIWKRYTEPATTSSKHVLSKPIVQAVMKQVKQSPRRSMMKTASLFGISRTSMQKIFKNEKGLLRTKSNPDSYSQQLPSRNDTEAK